MKRIYLSGKNGFDKYTLVDDELYVSLNEFRWYLGADGYVKRGANKKLIGKSEILLHRTVLKVPDDKYVDHINGDKLDNRSCNLRECTNQENQWNQSVRQNVSSKFKGVVKRKSNFEVSYSRNKKLTYVGKFTNEIAAANAYNYYASKEYGEFARLNDVPIMTYEEWNSYKSKPNKGKSQYTGIHWSKKVGKWESTLYVNGKQKFIGYYKTEEQAVNARNEKVIEWGLDMSKLQLIQYIVG